MNKNKFSIVIIVLFIISIIMLSFPLWEFNYIFGTIKLTGNNIIFGGGELGNIADMASSFGGTSVEYNNIAFIVLYIIPILGILFCAICDSFKKKGYMLAIIFALLNLNIICSLNDSFVATSFCIIDIFANIIAIAVAVIALISISKKKAVQPVQISQVEQKRQCTSNIVVCSDCGCENSAESAFCRKCGISLQKKPEKAFCSQCGAENATDSKFCHSCGNKINGGNI